MASFEAFLEVGGKRYKLHRYELSMHQETDTLGRPASPVLGGTILCVLNSPGQQDPFLYQWMMSPTMQQDGCIRLMQAAPKATEKTISFFNAYCTGLDISFMPGVNGAAGSSIIQLQISPQRVAVGAIVHDNNWPVPSHGAGETFAKQPGGVPQPPQEKEPGLVSDIAHTVLDVAGLIPMIGEVADGANALFYLAEGNTTDAALSAAAMIPIAGMAATGGKLLRKGAKVVTKARALKKAKNKVTTGANALAAAAERRAAKAANIPSYKTPHSPITPRQKPRLKKKLDSRTMTKDEYKRLEWDRRFNNRRSRGVSRFWAEERKTLRRGGEGTRNWSAEQREDILKGRVPKHQGEPIEGHHKYNALDHPQIADDPKNIYPATKKEHHKRWHGGDFKNDTRGVPLDKNYPEEF